MVERWSAIESTRQNSMINFSKLFEHRSLRDSNRSSQLINRAIWRSEFAIVGGKSCWYHVPNVSVTNDRGADRIENSWKLPDSFETRYWTDGKVMPVLYPQNWITSLVLWFYLINYIIFFVFWDCIPVYISPYIIFQPISSHFIYLNNCATIDNNI